MCKTKTFLILLLTCAIPAVHASTMGERFRSFILSETETTKAVAIDIASRQCMTCHSGSSGTHIQIKSAASPMQFSGLSNRNHPVGMQYAYYASRQPYSFRDPASLNTEIKLVDGRVGCLSCHKTKKNETQLSLDHNVRLATNNTCASSTQLTVGLRKSRLCMSCHKI